MSSIKCKDCIYEDKTSFCKVNKLAYAWEAFKVAFLAPFGKKPTPHSCRWFESKDLLKKPHYNEEGFDEKG